MKFKITIAYTGLGFCGWQRQAKPSGEKPSIQGILEETLSGILQVPITVVGSGRTDAGVNAMGQVAHFRTLEFPKMGLEKLQRAMNSRLPSSVRVLDAVQVDESFHAQRSAEKKQYKYFIQRGPCAHPLVIKHALWWKYDFDAQRVSNALQALVGTHDFGVFQSSGSKKGSTVRTLYKSDLEINSNSLLPMPEGFSIVHIRLQGSGFLRYMVRSIVGTCLQIGEGRLPENHFKVLLETQDRSLVGPTASAHGLWLEKVWYPLDESGRSINTLYD